MINMFFSIFGFAFIKDVCSPGGELYGLLVKLRSIFGNLLGGYIMGVLMIFPAMIIFAWWFYSSIFKGILHLVGYKSWDSWKKPENE